MNHRIRIIEFSDIFINLSNKIIELNIQIYNQLLNHIT